MFEKMDRALGKMESALSFIAMLMLLGFMLLGTANVIMRFAFNSPITGATEISQLMMAGSFLLVLASTQRSRQHTAMTDLVAHYPPRIRAIVEFIVLFIALVLFGMMTWRSSVAAAEMWKAGELVEVIRIPAAPFRLMLPIGAFFLCLEILSQMLRISANMFERGNK